MSVKATGFASPTQGYEEQGIDLNRLLIHNPPATYFVRMESGEMVSLGMPRGALLIVDRSIDPGPNSFVIIRHQGQFLCRMLIQENNKALFTDGKTNIIPIYNDTEIFGTVTAYIKELPNPHDISH